MSATAGALGDFLRARREQLRPEDVGLNSGPRRRVPGLRREELATLAGISVDYYLRLEQGRDEHPSSQVLEALARALRLDVKATEHLHGLAGLRATRVRYAFKQRGLGTDLGTKLCETPSYRCDLA